MENISDFFKDLKERLASPFFLSYIITWLIVNYKIVVVLLFYKANEVCMDGYTSYLDAIEKNSGTDRFLTLPLVGALAYTFLFPIFKNFIQAAGAWSKRWGTDWNLTIAKSGSIPVLKYIQLRDKYSAQISKYSEIVNSESDTLNQNLDLRSKIADFTLTETNLKSDLQNANDQNMVMKNQIELLNSEQKSAKTLTSIDSYNGVWDISMGLTTYGTVTIDNYQMTVRQDFDETASYEIVLITVNGSNVIFKLINKQTKSLAYWDLKVDDQLYKIAGIDESGQSIQMIRRLF